MNQPNAVPQAKTCFKCGYEADTAEKKCPNCRRRLRTRYEIQMLGGILTILGALLIAGMGKVTLWAIEMVNNAGTPGTGARFNGTKEQMYVMFGVFGFVILFGLTAVATGLWQLIFGKRNMILVWLILGLGALFLIGGTAVRFMLPN